MLAKLALRNAKRSLTDYTIYLITVTIAFSLMYSFNLLSFSKEILNLSKLMGSLLVTNIVCSVIIVIIVGWLINYMIRFMFERRGKEFATYMMLGIDNKSISKMFFIENSILSLFSLFIGFFIGTLIYQFLTAIIMKIFSLSFKISIAFSWKAVLLTFLYAFFVVFISIFGNRKKLRKMKIYDLMYLDKKNENVMNKKTKGSIVLFFISLALGIFGMVFLNYICVKNSKLLSSFTVLICLLSCIIGIYGTYFSISPLIIKAFLNNKLKYSNNTLFIGRSLSSKMNKMNFTLGTLSMLILLTLVAVQFGMVFKGFFDLQSKEIAPFEVLITSSKENYDFNDYISKLEQNEKIKDKYIYNVYSLETTSIKSLVENSSFNSYIDCDLYIKYSDYKKLRSMLGYSDVILDEDKFIVHCIEGVKDYLKDKQYNININGTDLTLQQYYTESFSLQGINGACYIVIIPDKFTLNTELFHRVLAVETIKPTTTETFDRLNSIENDDSRFLDVKGAIIVENQSSFIIFTFSLFYIALIFACVASTILAVQQLNDSTRYRYRYKILSRLGMTDTEINKTVLEQLLLFFGAPLLMPIPMSVSIIKSFSQYFIAFLGKGTIYMYMLSAIMSFLFIYIIYFVALLIGYIKNINSENLRN